MRLTVPILLFLACTAPSAALSLSSADIRMFLEGIDAGAEPQIAGEPLHNGQRVSAFYRSHEHAPLWMTGGRLADQRGALVRAIETSTRHGLNAGDYHYDVLLRSETPEDTLQALAAELLATDAFIQQVRHRTAGAVSPRELDPDWHFIPSEVDPLMVLERVLERREGLDEVLEALWPQAGEYQDLVDHRARILALGELEVEPVPAGPVLKPGQTGERVLALKRRLQGPGDHAPSFDDELREAVVAFQRAAGLETDGVVGPATLEVLNARRFSWIDRIDANLERWRWLPRNVPDTYVRVNIASYTLRVIRHGEDALRMDVIVGRPYRRTPVFTETIKYLVVNPYWNVPFRIAVQDKLPQLKADAAAQEALGFQARPPGQEAFLPVSAIDWSDVERSNFRYLLRQQPGPQNALGQVKLMLPNPYAVYLHDTPTRELFARQERSFSSGCVRLSNALELASWVLKNDGQASAAGRIDEMAASGQTRTLHLKTPLPTYMVYFTAFTDASGEVVFRRDLYQRDAPLVAALRS